MAQPSQINEHTRVVSGRISAAQFLSLEQELADRHLKRSVLVADLVITWLKAATGRGHRCTCADCPGNMRTMRRYVSIDEALFDSLTEDITA